MYSSHKLIDLLQLLPFQAQASARCFFFSHNQKIQLMPLNRAYVATSPTTVGAIVERGCDEKNYSLPKKGSEIGETNKNSAD